MQKLFFFFLCLVSFSQAAGIAGITKDELSPLYDKLHTLKVIHHPQYFEDKDLKARKELRMAMIEGDTAAFKRVFQAQPRLSLPQSPMHLMLRDVLDTVFVNGKPKEEAYSPQQIILVTMHACAGSLRAQETLIHRLDAGVSSSLKETIFSTLPFSLPERDTKDLNEYFKTHYRPTYILDPYETLRERILNILILKDPQSALTQALDWAQVGSEVAVAQLDFLFDSLKVSFDEAWAIATELLFKHKNPYALNLCRCLDYTEGARMLWSLVDKQVQEKNSMAVALSAALIQYTPEWALPWLDSSEKLTRWKRSQQKQLLALVSAGAVY